MHMWKELFLSLIAIILYSYAAISNSFKRTKLEPYEVGVSEEEAAVFKKYGKQLFNVMKRINDSGVQEHYPGTKWCDENLSKPTDENDFGTSVAVDKCCKQHAHCDAIPPNEVKHGINNTSNKTRYNCDCEEDFRECLLNEGSESANIYGTIYFNMYADKCFTLGSPDYTCIPYKSQITPRTLKYITNAVLIIQELSYIGRCEEITFNDSSQQKYVEYPNYIYPPSNVSALFAIRLVAKLMNHIFPEDLSDILELV